MLESTITGKGQVTIPKEVRKKFNLLTGNKVEFFLKSDHIVIIPINKNLKSLKGILPKPPSALSYENMNEIIRGSK